MKDSLTKSAKSSDSKNTSKEVKNSKKDAAAVAAVGKKITDKKDLKYIYPADVDTTSKRKKFRTQARAKFKSLEKNVRLITKGKIEGDVKTAEKEFGTWKSATYTPDYLKQLVS